MFFDAHNHLAGPVLRPHLDTIADDLRDAGFGGAVVNGTCPDDWPEVRRMAGEDPRLIPAVGLHPWNVPGAPDHWREVFSEAIKSAEAVGEIGLDRWIREPAFDRQIDAFRWQLAHAAEHDLPCSIHCLKAAGPLMELLRETRLPERGFHLHAFNGSPEMLDEVVRLGGYVSFNPGQLKPNAKRVRETLRRTPRDRLLVETDAPDMPPTEEWRDFHLPDTDDGRTVNHPANLRAAYRAVAALRDTGVPELAATVADNFRRFFGRLPEASHA